VSGNKGYFYWILDPELKQAAIDIIYKRVTIDETTKMTYIKALKKLRDKPFLLITSAHCSFARFFSRIPLVFAKKSLTTYFVLLLVLVYFFALFDNPQTLLANIFTLPGYRIVLSTTVIILLLFLWNTIVCWLTIMAIGCLFVIFLKDRHILSFLVLYAAGIILSLFFLGAVGGGRMWLSQQVFVYLLCCYCLTKFYSRISPLPLPGQFILDKPALIKSSIITVLCLASLFIFAPLVLRTINKPSSRDLSITVTPELVTKDLNLGEPVIPKETIWANIIMWPEPTFETLSGTLAYLTPRYRKLDATFLKADEGITERSEIFAKWHLSPLPFPRVAFDDRSPIIFPYADIDKLSRFEQQEIIVVGRLLGRKRLLIHHQGYLLIAEFIGYQDENGNLTWISVKDL